MHTSVVIIVSIVVEDNFDAKLFTNGPTLEKAPKRMDPFILVYIGRLTTPIRSFYTPVPNYFI